MRGFIIALTFMTRIPFPAPANVTQKEFTNSQYYHPFVGLLIGILLWGISKLALGHFSPLIIGALL